MEIEFPLEQISMQTNHADKYTLTLKANSQVWDNFWQLEGL